jgi:pseudaminic acid synthase|tara:strand:- start:232 stop:1260 length:1029 start_codon:yes stop_codon:yes gene_type:complete
MKKKFINKVPFFIAEISGNHGGNINDAKKLILNAKKYGADAVKLQTYTADMMTLKNNEKIKNGIWKKENLWNLYHKAHTPLEWHKELFEFAKKIDIKIFSSPFSEYAVNFLETINCPAYKIASFEMNDLNLIRSVARTKKPLIISTGTFDLKDIQKTINFAKQNGATDITILYCVSAYPSEEKDFNLNNIKILGEKFNCRIGFSDHSIGSKMSEYAAIMGAEVFEKHIATKSVKNAVDKKFSLMDRDIKNYKQNINQAYNLIKIKNFYRTEAELQNSYYRRSIYAIKTIKPGDIFTKENIVTLRPNKGIAADEYINLLGKRNTKLIKKNTCLKKKQLKQLKR